MKSLGNIVKRTFGAILFFPAAVCLFFPAGQDICRAAEAQASVNPITINVGYVIDSFTGVPLEDAKIAIRLIFEKRFKERYPQHSMEVLFLPDMTSAVAAIKNGRINALGVTTLDYLITRDENNLEPVRVAQMGYQALSRFVLLARKEQVRSLEHLRHKSILIEKGGHGRVGALWLNTLLLEQSLPESRDFFRTVDRIEQESQSVLKVFFEKSDACVVQKRTFELMKELNPQIGVKLHALDESPEFLMGIFAIVKGLDPQTRDLMISFTDGFLNDQEGDTILSLFRVKGIKVFSPEDIETLESLYRSYRRLKKTGKAKAHEQTR